MASPALPSVVPGNEAPFWSSLGAPMVENASFFAAFLHWLAIALKWFLRALLVVLAVGVILGIGSLIFGSLPLQQLRRGGKPKISTDGDAPPEAELVELEFLAEAGHIGGEIATCVAGRLARKSYRPQYKDTCELSYNLVITGRGLNLAQTPYTIAHHGTSTQPLTLWHWVPCQVLLVRRLHNRLSPSVRTFNYAQALVAENKAFPSSSPPKRCLQLCPHETLSFGRLQHIPRLPNSDKSGKTIDALEYSSQQHVRNHVKSQDPKEERTYYVPFRNPQD